MTSNLGSEYLLNGQKDQVDILLHQTFKPEFLNRIDEIVYFNPLSKDTQAKIVAKMLGELKSRLAESYYELNFTENLKDYILENAYSPIFGARPIKRFIQNKVETVLANKIIAQDMIAGHHYLIDVVEDEILVRSLDADA